MLVAVLTLLKIPFQREYSGTPELGQKRFDFLIQVNGVFYLIEFDGIQHFKDKVFFAKKHTLQQRQHIDIVKHLTALKYGCRMIRLDHTLEITEEIFKQHITTALSSSQPSYYSSPSLYSHIICAEQEYLSRRHLHAPEHQTAYINYLADLYTNDIHHIMVEF